MAELQTMPDLSWTVRCWNASNQYIWLYVFSRNGNVRWKDENNGMTGNGTWQIKGNTLYTRWHNSGTEEKWKLPINTSNWTGDCTMKGVKYSLHAIARNYIEINTPTVYSRTPESKDQFIKKCSRATATVQRTGYLFTAWISGITIAYSRAFKAHNSLLSDISATQKLAEDLLLGFALAGLGGGVGGAVGAAMKAATKNEFMIDGIKDLAKFSVRGTGAAVFQAHALKGMPSNPLEWQSCIIEKVASELALVSGQVIDWSKAVETDDDNFDSDFDPVTEVEDDLTIRNDGVVINFRMLPEVSKEQLQLDFEKGWLVAWIKNCARGDVTDIPLVRESVKETLRKEGTRLGVTDIKTLLDKHIPINNDALIRILQ